MKKRRKKKKKEKEEEKRKSRKRIIIIIKTNHLIPARRADLIIINKKENLPNCGLCCSGWPQSKIESKRKEGYVPGPCSGMKNKQTVEHESNDYTNCNWFSWYCQQRMNKGTGGLGNKRTSRDHPNYCIIEISQNTKESPEDLSRLAVTQTSVKDHHLKLMWKILSE